MKKEYLIPEIEISFCTQDVVLGSGMANDDFDDGYNIVGNGNAF